MTVGKTSGMFGQVAKRIGLFLAVNLLVVVTIGLIASFLGLGRTAEAGGLNVQALFVLCFLWGMGGALFSLSLSRIIAKWSMSVRVIDPSSPAGSRERAVLAVVHALAKKAGLRTMPEVGIYDSPEMNAFATGPTKNRALVAVSTGLLEQMNDDEIEGVLGHELAHVTNGDMVTMTLIQGVVNAFTMFFARLLAYAVSSALSGRRDDEGNGGGGGSPFLYFVLVNVFQIVLSLFGAFVVAWFSRRREYRADAGGAGLAGRIKMIHALDALRRNSESRTAGSFGNDFSAGSNVPQTSQSIDVLKISREGSSLLSLFSTHPPLEARIQRLRGA